MIFYIVVFVSQRAIVFNQHCKIKNRKEVKWSSSLLTLVVLTGIDKIEVAHLLVTL